jgi:hypothetical protein
MMIDLRRLGREPALLTAAGSLLAQLGTALFMDLSPEIQGAVNALAVAIAALLTSWGVAADKLLPILLGVVQAGIALALAFGVQLPAEDQSTIMAFVTMVLGAFMRTQLFAKVELSTGRHSRQDDYA